MAGEPLPQIPPLRLDAAAARRTRDVFNFSRASETDAREPSSKVDEDFPDPP